MGFLRRLLGRETAAAPDVPMDWSPTGPIAYWPSGNEFRAKVPAILFEPEGRFRVNVVGESAYQGTLQRLGGGRTVDGVRKPIQTAYLVPEPDNVLDGAAVRVLVASGIEAGVVGYLSREDARWYRPVIDRVAAMGKLIAARAALHGGWDRGEGDWGSIGVVLHLRPPTDLMAELDSEFGLDPVWANAYATTNSVPDRSYNRSDCPYCGEVMDPLPKAKKRCPSCGQSVYVRSGPDGIRNLLREVDLPPMAARWDAYQENRADEAAATINVEAAALSQASLQSLHDAGVKVVEMSESMPDACPTCRALAGRRYPIQRAPTIPVPGCTNDICRCDYLPVVGGQAGP